MRSAPDLFAAKKVSDTISGFVELPVGKRLLVHDQGRVIGYNVNSVFD